LQHSQLLVVAAFCVDHLQAWRLEALEPGWQQFAPYPPQALEVVQVTALAMALLPECHCQQGACPLKDLQLQG
jgi:hypothetical protein